MANLKFSDVFRALNIGFGVKEEGVVTNNLHGDTKVTSSSEDVDFDVEPTKLNEKSYFEFSEPLLRQEKYFPVHYSDELEDEEEEIVLGRANVTFVNEEYVVAKENTRAKKIDISHVAGVEDIETGKNIINNTFIVSSVGNNDNVANGEGPAAIKRKKNIPKVIYPQKESF